MSYTVYGQPLPEGHCEQHPEVAEPWPCSICQRIELEERWADYKDDDDA